MKKFFFFLLFPALSFAQVNNIPCFKGITNQISIVKKSAATPTCKFKDGSEIKLWNDDNGIKVTMNKNGETWDFLEQNTDAIYAQVGEFDFGTSLLIHFRSWGESFTGSWAIKASISASRSQIRRSATDCTRPAEREPGSLRHSTGESVKPTR